MIYFVRMPTGSIKIGTTRNLSARLGTLRHRHGCRIEVLATIPGDRAREAEIHEQFAHLRLGKTEQFRPGSDLLAFIGITPAEATDPDAVEATRPVADLVMVQLSTEERAKFDALSARLSRKAGRRLTVSETVHELIARHTGVR